MYGWPCVAMFNPVSGTVHAATLLYENTNLNLLFLKPFTNRDVQIGPLEWISI